MSCLGSSIIGGASGQGGTDYVIERSLRFNSGDTAYLNRTPSTVSNRKTWTWSGWVKRSNLSTTQTLFSAAVDANNRFQIYLFSDDTISIYGNNSGSAVLDLQTIAVYRDPSSWFHLLVSVDTTQSTTTDRCKIYINGGQPLDITGSPTYPAQNTDLQVNDTCGTYIGTRGYTAADYADCYLAEVYLIDGQALAPADFGETDDNGVWQPKKYTGAYVTAGSHTPATYNSYLGNDVYTSEFNDMVDGSLSTYGEPNGRYIGFNYSTSNNSTINVKILPNQYVTIEIRPRINGSINYNAGNWVGTTSNTKVFSSSGTAIETGFTLPANHDGAFQLYMSGSSAARSLEIYDMGGTGYLEPNNSFHLKFNDNSNNSALGNDSSGMNNTWTVNNLVAFATPIYSNDITYTNTNYNGYPATNAFDGQITTSTYTSNYGDSIFYNPSSSLTYSSEVEFYISWNMDIKINGGSFVTYNTTGWNTIATGSGTITSLEVKNATGSYGRWLALRVDGVILIDGTGALPASVDCLIDTPSNRSQIDTGAGGEVVGNYCTLNPLDTNGSVSTSNGNLEATSSASTGNVICGSLQVTSGKWYWEASMTSATKSMIGVADGSQMVANRNFENEGWYYFSENGNKYHDNNNASYGAIYGQNDIIGVALDMDAGTLTFYKNGVSQGVAYSTDLSGLSIVPALGNASSGGTSTVVFNFGQRAFAHAAPSGYKALCTTNLPDPTIADGSKYFDVALDTGANILSTATSKTDNAGFVWIKDRENASTNNILFNKLNDPGMDGTPHLRSDTTDSEATCGTYAAPSGNSVGWVWDAGTSTVTNTDGTLTSQVRANPSAGFSIVSYTGNSSSATVGHGLNAVPEMIIVKDRDNSYNWQVAHIGISADDSLLLNSSDEATDYNAWNNTRPTSSVFSLTAGTLGVNTNGADLIAYCFTPVEGYSAIGSYIGNNSSDGPFVYTGFKPAFVMIKVKSGATNDWAVFDNKREGYNPDNSFVAINENDTENSASRIHLLSNGFQCVNSSTLVNGPNDSYIYLAFAEHPIKYARAR